MLSAEAMIVSQEAKRLERIGVRWFAVSWVGAGIAIGAILSFVLLGFWRPHTILDGLCILGFVIFAVGLIVALMCYKNAEWEKDDSDDLK
jgi:hypothetical protein